MATSAGKRTEINSGHTDRQWQKKFFAMGARCYYCGKTLYLKDATKDHRTPLCRGGSDNIRNLVPACLPCNQEKGWKTEAEFLKVSGGKFSTNSQSRVAINLDLQNEDDGENNDSGCAMPLTQRDEPDLSQLRRESEGGCPIGFKSWAG